MTPAPGSLRRALNGVVWQLYTMELSALMYEACKSGFVCDLL
jgi:hypothetical protein